MTEKLDTQYIREALSRSCLTYEDAEQVIPWLRQAVEEIESLRSQLDTAIKHLEMSDNVKDLLRHRAQQAEQERDDNASQRDEWVNDFVKAHKNNQQLREANTAMREALEFYADSKNHSTANGAASPAYVDYGTRASIVLSRYPKEGDTQ